MQAGPLGSYRAGLFSTLWGIALYFSESKKVLRMDRTAEQDSISIKTEVTYEIQAW